MLPTPDVQPSPYPAPPGGHRAPAAVQALRVVAWVELALLTVGVLFGLGAAILSAPGLDDSGEGASWAMAFVVFGLVFAGLCLTLALAVGIPLLLLRDTRPGRRTGALATMAGVHAVVGLGLLTLSVISVGSVGVTGAFLPLVVVAVTSTAVVLAVQPAARQWAATRT